MNINVTNFNLLIGIPHDEEGPIFEEPWQAQVFALVVRLHEEGHFTWDEWVSMLGREISAAQMTDATYYHSWVRAIGELCARKGLVDRNTADRRVEEWRLAYLNTPHGQPVELSAASNGTATT